MPSSPKFSGFLDDVFGNKKSDDKSKQSREPEVTDILGGLFSGLKGLSQTFFKDDRSERAKKGSEIPMIQQAIHEKMGITGKGVVVGIIEDTKGEKAKTIVPMDNKSPDHVTHVSKVLSDEKVGVAPGTAKNLYFYSRFVPEVPSTDDFKDSPGELEDTFIDIASYSLETITARLNKILAEKSNRPRVLNVSMGMSRLQLAVSLLKKLEEPFFDGRKGFVNPNVRESLYGLNADSLSKEERRNIALKYINTILDEDLKSNGQFSKALASYKATTAQLAKEGIFLVVCAGNDHSILKNTRLSAEDEVNFLSMSDHVISAASAYTNEAPGNRTRYTLADTSSRGKITVAAPGKEIFIEDNFLISTIQDGTSFAAPFISGTITLMLEANPKLTFDDVIQIFSQSATKIPEYTEADYGFGFLDPILAVEMAKKMNPGQAA